MTEITDSPQGKVEVTVGILYEGDYVVIDAGGNLGIWAKDRFEEVHDKLEPSLDIASLLSSKSTLSDDAGQKMIDLLSQHVEAGPLGDALGGNDSV